MKRILVLLALVSACATPAVAQTYSESHLAAAAELLEAGNMQEIMNASMEATLQSQLESSPDLRELEHVMRDFFGRYLTWEAVREGYMQLYVSRFSEAELREITAFYRSPTGAKLADLTPGMTVEGAKLGERLVQENMGELQAMIFEHLSRQQ